MKKCFAFILVLCALILSGCGSDVVNKLDMDAASKKLDEKFTNMKDMDVKELDAVYGVDVSIADEYVIKSSTLNNGYLYAIFKVNKGKESELKKQLGNMFDILIKNSNLYSPEAVKLIKNRLEVSVGDYLIYIVSDNNQAMYDIVKENMS